jgi:hypothetical protein
MESAIKKKLCHLQQKVATGDHHVNQNKPGSEGQRPHVFSHMQNLDHIYDMIVIVGLFGQIRRGERGKENDRG